MLTDPELDYASMATSTFLLFAMFPSLRRFVVNQWNTSVIQVARAKETRQLWTWVPFPPLGIVRECLKDRLCSGCHGTVSPFIFIGKLPNGPYMAFRRPIQLVRNGTLGLVLAPKDQPVQAVVKAQPPETPAPPFQGYPFIEIDLPHMKPLRKPAKKAPKKATKKTVKEPRKKVAKQPLKKIIKKIIKKTSKTTTGRRRAT